MSANDKFFCILMSLSWILNPYCHTDRDEHDGHYAKNSKPVRPKREKIIAKRFACDSCHHSYKFSYELERHVKEYHLKAKKILDMKFDGSRGFQFLVRWEGYGNDHNSWKPVVNVSSEISLCFQWPIKNLSERNFINPNEFFF